MESPTEARLIFEPTVRQLFESLTPGVAASVALEWRELGIDLAGLLPSYPVEQWWLAVARAAAHLEGDSTERLRQLGRGLTVRFTQSFLGKAAGPLGRLIGPRRSLQRSQVSFRAGNNYLLTEVVLDEPKHVRLRTNEATPVAELLAGSIEEMVMYTGGRQVQVSVTLEPAHTIYDIRWR
jgi:uncharacterized protein (TIGR02265 family)